MIQTLLLLHRYDNEKKGAAKVEKARRESVVSRQEQEKRSGTNDTSILNLSKLRY